MEWGTNLNVKLRESFLFRYFLISGLLFSLVIFLEFKLSKTFLDILRPPRPEHKINRAAHRSDREKRHGTHRHRRPRHKVMGMKPRTFVAIAFAAPLVLLFIIHHLLNIYLFRRAANQTREVLQELKSGNLKARFPKNGKDNLGIISTEVNDMADELEKLVLSLEKAEIQRKSVLQELVHDLRTPITSLRSMLELLRDHRDSMSKGEADDFLNSSLSEIKYFQKLISDLLIISDLTESNMNLSMSKINLCEIINDQINSFKSYNKKIISNHNCIELAFIYGNRQQLKRLFQNSIDNAISFTTTNIEVLIFKNEKNWIVEIIDDGLGVSPEKQKSFGDKFRSREVAQSDEDRISIGLGAVIMKKIVLAHKGELMISNREDTAGAILRISIPEFVER